MKLIGWFFPEGRPVFGAEPTHPIPLRVLVGTESSNPRDFEAEYGIDIVTEAFMRSYSLSSSEAGAMMNPTLVVKAIDRAIIHKAIEEQLDRIQLVGIRIGYTAAERRAEELEKELKSRRETQ